MKDIGFFIKKLDHESGVMVSLKHLQKNLSDAGIISEIKYYDDDYDLLNITDEKEWECINLHVPSFSDDTLDLLLNKHDNVVLSIHSTICNLQTEGEAFARILRLGNSGINNLRFTCPSKVECHGLNSITEGKYIYLPNTFAYKANDSEFYERIEQKSKSLDRPLKISLFCEYRPSFRHCLFHITIRDS